MRGILVKVNRLIRAGRGYALLAALLFGALCVQALAADFQAGVEAYNRGDYAGALREFRPLAEQGHAKAQYNLGFMYDEGLGVPQNHAQAAKWYRKAAEQGHVSAQNSLGVKYVRGEGVPEDDVQAYAWFNIAAAQGYDHAEHNKKLIAESITREQRAQAQELARQYWEAYVLPFQN